MSARRTVESCLQPTSVCDSGFLSPTLYCLFNQRLLTAAQPTTPQPTTSLDAVFHRRLQYIVWQWWTSDDTMCPALQIRYQTSHDSRNNRWVLSSNRFSYLMCMLHRGIYVTVDRRSVTEDISMSPVQSYTVHFYVVFLWQNTKKGKPMSTRNCRKCPGIVISTVYLMSHYRSCQRPPCQSTSWAWLEPRSLTCATNNLANQSNLQCSFSVVSMVLLRHTLLTSCSRWRPWSHAEGCDPRPDWTSRERDGPP